MSKRGCFGHRYDELPDTVRFLLDEIHILIIVLGRYGSVEHGSYKTVYGRKRSSYIMCDR